MNIHDFELPLHPLLLGPLSETLPLWRKNRKWSSIFLICDENTYQYCAPALWEAGIDPNIPKVIVAAGEQYKHLGTCQQIWTAMFDARLDRHALRGGPARDTA